MRNDFCTKEKEEMEYIARVVPRMCLPRTHELYKWSHEDVYQYFACDGELYPDPYNTYELPPGGVWITHLYGYQLRGEDEEGEIMDCYPKVPEGMEVRPMSIYAIVTRIPE